MWHEEVDGWCPSPRCYLLGFHSEIIRRVCRAILRCLEIPEFILMALACFRYSSASYAPMKVRKYQMRIV